MRLSWAELNERAEVTHAIDEPVRGIRVVKAFGREEEEISEVEGVTARAYVYSMTRIRLLARYDAFLKAVPIVSAAVLLGDRRLAGVHRRAVARHLPARLPARRRDHEPRSGVFGEITNAWQYLRGAQDRLAEMLALGTRPVTDGRMVPAPASGLELDNVSVLFSGRELLHGLTATAVAR